jgi:hypothetical protein
MMYEKNNKALAELALRLAQLPPMDVTVEG